MRNKTCCFTGHREIEARDIEKIRNNIRNCVIELVERGVIYFGAGGARGFDTLAAEVVLELKETFPNIRLILILPCANQTRVWSAQEKLKYEHIKRKADKTK